jgi:hypothetical protein
VKMPLIELVARFRFQRNPSAFDRRWKDLSEIERSQVREKAQQIVAMLGGEDEMIALCEVVIARAPALGAKK